VLWRIAIILKANKGNLFVSSVLFVFWYHSPNFLDTPRIKQHSSVRITILAIESKNALPFYFWDTCSQQHKLLHWKGNNGFYSSCWDTKYSLFPVFV
jgi:hypothetical protein